MSETSPDSKSVLLHGPPPPRTRERYFTNYSIPGNEGCVRCVCVVCAGTCKAVCGGSECGVTYVYGVGVSGECSVV